VAAGLLPSCTLCDNLNCDAGGGGGGGGSGSFERGLVFIRPGMYDVFAAPSPDFTDEALTSGGSFRHPTVSPDGSSVVVASRDGRRLMRLSTSSNVSAATLLDSTSGVSGFRHPAISPDGRYVVFVYDTAGASALGRVNADGTGGEVQLAGGGATFLTSPSFDAQGRLVAAAGTAGNISQLVYVNVNNGQLTPIASIPSSGVVAQLHERAVVSPDGTRVAFDGLSSSGSVRLYLLQIATGTVSTLSVGPGNQNWPAWIGNTTLAFTSDSGGESQLYRAPISGGSAELVVPSAIEPTFGPN
jgi:TolB protein